MSSDPSIRSSEPPCAGDGEAPLGALAWHREQVDRVDAALVQLLDARAALVARIGRAKRAAGLPVAAPEREEDVLRRIEAWARGPMPPGALRRIWQVILDASRQAQQAEA
ncbi:MAG: chorismate mutase [Candidatus Eisenbacteria bacterium]